MKSSIDHIQLFIDYLNINFYKDLLQFLGWKMFMEEPDEVGFNNEKNETLWIAEANNNGNNDYDKIGMNHLSFRVESQKNVDKVTVFLKKQHIPTLFGTPKHRPEYAKNEKETYYQIMFESPDQILFEVVYIGVKDKSSGNILSLGERTSST
ncbi:MAG TPA: hypothetical protein VLG12_02315 [Candidatus Saccharimonadales bacterium]|nr:hypothetical protein [Candidatus Saccharimonadales bacterium]